MLEGEFKLLWVTEIDTFMPIYGLKVQIPTILKSYELLYMSKKISKNLHSTSKYQSDIFKNPNQGSRVP